VSVPLVILLQPNATAVCFLLPLCLALWVVGKSKDEIVAGSVCQLQVSNCARAFALTVSLLQECRLRMAVLTFSLNKVGVGGGI
jgi:hypothetical protein